MYVMVFVLNCSISVNVARGFELLLKLFKGVVVAVLGSFILGTTDLGGVGRLGLGVDGGSG